MSRTGVTATANIANCRREVAVSCRLSTRASHIHRPAGDPLAVRSAGREACGDLPELGSRALGCAFAPDGTLFTAEVGDPATNKGQLMMWFAPYEGHPVAPGEYPDTDAVSTNFYKLDTKLGTVGEVDVDSRGRGHVAASSSGAVYRYSPPFPRGPDVQGGCGVHDGTGVVLADQIHKEALIRPDLFRGMLTFSGLASRPTARSSCPALRLATSPSTTSRGAFSVTSSSRRLCSFRPPTGIRRESMSGPDERGVTIDVHGTRPFLVEDGVTGVVEVATSVLGHVVHVDGLLEHTDDPVRISVECAIVCSGSIRVDQRQILVMVTAVVRQGELPDSARFAGAGIDVESFPWQPFRYSVELREG